MKSPNNKPSAGNIFHRYISLSYNDTPIKEFHEVFMHCLRFEDIIHSNRTASLFSHHFYLQ